MKKTEKIFLVLVVLACVGIIVFWIAGFRENKDIAAAAFITSGTLCWAALGVKFFDWLRHRRIYGY